MKTNNMNFTDEIVLLILESYKTECVTPEWCKYGSDIKLKRIAQALRRWHK